MSPDQVAKWCKADSFTNPDFANVYNFRIDLPALKDLRDISPVQLDPNIDVLITDYQALAGETRLYSQVRDEVHANFKPIDAFKAQLCQ